MKTFWMDINRIPAELDAGDIFSRFESVKNLGIIKSCEFLRAIKLEVGKIYIFRANPEILA